MFPDLLKERLAGIVDLSAEQIGILEAHYELLVRWNRSLNLTSISGLEATVERHYCESLYVGRFLDGANQRIVDIGSGPGFPGFPVAVLRPDCSVALVESHQRKAVFLSEASRGLSNIRVISKRAEDVAETFDWAISRAVSYQDLSRSLKRLAPRALLLTGADPPPDSLGFSWRQPIPLPWGDQRFVQASA